MFTGIITDIGLVREIERRGDLHVRIGTALDVADTDIGASIACDGVCLTVTDTGADEGGWFAVDISTETVSKTTLGDWKPGRRINLERALRVGDELGGHIVSGHVDSVAEVMSTRDEGASTRVSIRAPDALARFIAPKGSVSLNGTSLTVNDVRGAEFDVNLIPHTKAITTWGKVAVGDAVNLEVDTMARYVQRLREWDA